MRLACHNLAVNCHLGTAIDLQLLVARFPFFKRTQSAFPPVMCHFLHPRCTVSVFSTGNTTVVGPKNFFAIYYVLNRLVALLRPLFPGVSVGPLFVRNLTCGANLGARLDIARFAAEHADVCTYVPEVYPSMNVQAGDGVMHLVFETGSVVVTGARTLEAAGASLAAWAPRYLTYAADPQQDARGLGAQLQGRASGGQIPGPGGRHRLCRAAARPRKQAKVQAAPPGEAEA